MVEKEYDDEPGLIRPDAEEGYFQHRKYESLKRERPSFFQKIFSRSETPFIIIGALLILCILTFLSLSRKDKADEIGPRLALIEERLVQLEAQTAKIPEINGAMEKLGNQVAVTERYADRFEQIEASITMMTDKMARDLAELKKAASRPVVKKAGSPPAPVRAEKRSAPAEKRPASVEKRPAAASKPVYHVVGAGETLYSISRRYHMTVDALRRLNNLPENKAIQTGQKLMVKAGNKKK